MATSDLRIRVDLSAFVGKLQRIIQHWIDLVSFGLQAADQVTGDSLTLPGAYLAVYPARNETMEFELAKTEFQTWLLAAGLRECVEAVHSFLEEARRVCALYSLASQGSITGKHWNERFIQEGKRFHQLGLPHKLDFLRKQYDESIAPDLSQELLTINRARNCLVHRRGIVSARDLNVADALEVKWVKFELVVDGEKGERVIIPPAQMDAGEVLMIRQVASSEAFKKGEAITFTAQEFSEVCWTIVQFGRSLSSKLESYGSKLGIRFGEASGG